MARDPMRMLRTVRLLSVEQARQALAACLTAEAGVAARLQAIEDAAQRDRAAAGTNGNHLFTDMFVRGRQARAEARRLAEADMAACQAASAQARSELTAARTAAEAVDTLIAERARNAEVDAQKREQHVLDDIARSRFDTMGR